MKWYEKRLIIALFMIVVAVFVILLLDATIGSDELKNRLLGRNMWEKYDGFSIQNIMWVFFFIGLGELLFRKLQTKKMLYGIEKPYLPQDDSILLDDKKLIDIAKDLKDDTHIDGVANFLKKLIMQFQTSHSVNQTLSMLNAQIEMKSAQIDLQYNIIRYITWLIPTLGFIGTVIGIGEALKTTARLNGQGETFISQVAGKLAIAFDTTFVGLIMSAILVFLMYIVQGKEEQSLVDIGKYSLDNLINKLYEGDKNG